MGFNSAFKGLSYLLMLHKLHKRTYKSKRLQMLERKGTKWSRPVSKKLSNLSPEDSKEIHEKHQPE